MTLLLEVAGVVAGVWILTSLIRSYVPGLESFRVAVIAVAAVVGTIISASQFSSAVTTLDQQAHADRAYTPYDAVIAGSGAAGANALFLTWAGSLIPARATYYLVDHPDVGFWTTFQLMPRRAVASPRDAQWLVLYGVGRSAAGPAGRFFGNEIAYAPNFGIAPRG